jgi:hypothetical protein
MIADEYFKIQVQFLVLHLTFTFGKKKEKNLSQTFKNRFGSNRIEPTIASVIF